MEPQDTGKHTDISGESYLGKNMSIYDQRPIVKCSGFAGFKLLVVVELGWIIWLLAKLCGNLNISVW